MALNYEFDVFSVSSTKPTSAPVMQEMLTELDLKMQNKIALFRSQNTVDALKAADPRVRGMFQNAGYGLYIPDAKMNEQIVDDKEAHAVFLVRVTDGIEKTFSEKELDLDDILAKPSVDGSYDEGIEPEDAFVVLDWLNATIEVHEMAEGDFGDDDDEMHDDLDAFDHEQADLRDLITKAAKDDPKAIEPETDSDSFSVDPDLDNLGLLETEMADIVVRDAKENDVDPRLVPITEFRILPKKLDTATEPSETDLAQDNTQQDYSLELDLADLDPSAVTKTVAPSEETAEITTEIAAETIAKTVVEPAPEIRRTRKSDTLRRVRVLDVDQLMAAKQPDVTDDAPAVSTLTALRKAFLARFNSPFVGVVAGLALSGAGIILISQILV